MKIPFDIAKRPQIESGEYKVETRDGKKVRVLCYDANNIVPIVALVTFNDGSEVSRDYYSNGTMIYGKEYPLDLFIITPEEELTEFEQQIENLLNLCLPEGHAGTTIENTKRVAAELLALAFREFKENEATHIKEFVDHKLKEAYEKGKAEALKDLPRWSKNAFPRGCAAIDISGLTGADYIRREGKLLSISDLEKLPGFKEE